MNIDSVTTEELQHELKRREGLARSLLAKREKLVQELHAIDHQLDSQGVNPAPTSAVLSALRRVQAAGRQRQRYEAQVQVTDPADSWEDRQSAGKAEHLPAVVTNLNTLGLGDALAHVLEPNVVVSPAEACERVRAEGYESSSKNLQIMVSNTLSKDFRFKRVGHGRYERIP